jgi:hypothetical protein
MARDSDTRWQPPSRFAPGKKIFGWVDEITQDGEGWLQSQSFWSDIERAENIVRGKECRASDQNRSSLTSNRLKRLFREVGAAISDVRYPDAWSSDNKSYQAEAEMFSKVCKGVWYEARAPLSIRRLSQWMILGGSGALWPVYRRRRIVDPFSAGICFDDIGPRDLVPFMVPDDGNNQGCYANTIVRMMPVPKAHALFPTFQDKLRPVTRKRMRSSAVSARLAFIDSLRGENRSLPWCEQLCEIRYTLVGDLSINTTDLPMPMGDPGASWSYVVPALGADMPTDNPMNGERKMRQATADDARLYPNKRLIITGSGVDVPMYDGPAWDWHGMFPPRFFADDWVTEPMGFSLVRDVFDLEGTRQFTERSVDMRVKAAMDPSFIYDQTTINPGTAEEFDPWEMRKRLGVDGDVEKVLRTAIPEAMLKIPSESFEWLAYLAKSQDDQLGMGQWESLAKSKGATGGESSDDLLKIAGPIVRDISASMEPPMADVLEMVKYQILQFFNTARVMTYVGPDGVTPQTFDFEPDKIIPSTLDGEDPAKASQWSRMERAKSFARNMRLQIAPGSIHGISQTQQKLLLLQGKKSGEPIPSRIIFEKVYGLENYEGLRDEWRADKEWELEMAAKMKEEGASLQSSAPPGTATASGSQKGTGGRPPSGKKPPAAKTKGSAEGPRATVTQS